MKQRVATLVLLMFSVTVAAQSGARAPLEGVWKLTEIVVTGAGAFSSQSPNPGLFIFTKTHYSVFVVPVKQPRALFATETPTTAEKVAAFESMAANTGTYDISGSTLTVRPMVAKNPNCSAGGAFLTYQFRLERNRLVLTQKSSDANCLIAQRPAPSAVPANETHFTLTRVE